MKLFATVLATAYAGAADYSVQGDNWGDACATGMSQSPIDIETETAWSMADHDPWVTDNWYNLHDWEVAYKAGLKFTPMTEDIYTMGGNLDTNTGDEQGKWRLAQFHLHWGGELDEGVRMGSEHTFDGHQYFSEVHFVHYNTKYGGLGEAAVQPDGLAVLGYFIDNHEGDYETDLDVLLQTGMQNVLDHQAAEAVGAARKRRAEESAAGAEDEWKNIVRGAAGDFVDHIFTNYYRYGGSLTTPGCFETVQWTVFDKPLTINKKTVEMMASMSDETDFENNWRNTQPMNGRTLDYYHPYEEVEMSSATTTSLSCATLAFVYGQL